MGTEHEPRTPRAGRGRSGTGPALVVQSITQSGSMPLASGQAAMTSRSYQWESLLRATYHTANTIIHS
jgi:hypothetical protein